MRKKCIVALSFAFLVFSVSFAQDPTRFEEEVGRVQAQYPSDQHRGSVVFTGSSSVRLWKDLATDFPNHSVVNTGFGGSHATDLLHYLDELVLDYQPKKVFIYEGDNDISGKKTTGEIMQTMDQIVRAIHAALPNTEVVFISAKPSISRWNLANQYKELNTAMKRYARSTKGVGFADVWKPMLGKNGQPMPDIFIEDNLHMNRKGYEIWAKVIGKHMN
ncbi:hypothetical protein ADIS_4833 [Lunatimonas lonarensis]|uniref:SGNH hydrolase-type esterase domain-containing protein n=1 Tax=Lunatimonas lonarensis TaxID=1232681 RepID=R7ZKX1_9BACT|nr:SGNH/GDSL hydrolase family protein [Lunatimonas lonarensis]EON74722.1 hypothetical protein ADIS_4833 [Lunatimonas lonarensis]